MIDWGCPDWRDATAYPSSPDELGDTQWRWEFLRRLPKYRRLWEKHSDHCSEDGEPVVQLAGVEQMYFAYEFGRNALMDPAIPAVYTEFYDITGSLELLSEAWIDPGFIQSDDEEAGRHALEYKRIDCLLQNLGIYGVRFNINKPLDVQLDRARGILEDLQATIGTQASQFKKRRNKWGRHLRVIDAKDQDATHKEIYEQFADEKSGGDELKKDELYRAGRQHNAVVSQWHSQAIEIMEKASRLL